MANMNAGMSEAPRSSVVPTMGRSALANELWRLPARLRQTLELRDWVIDTVDVVVSTFVVFTDPHEDRWLDERLNCLQSQILAAHPVPGRVAGHLRVSDDDAVILRRSVRRGIAELRVQRDTNGSSGPASSVTSASINAAMTCKPAPTAKQALLHVVGDVGHRHTDVVWDRGHRHLKFYDTRDNLLPATNW